MDESVCGANVHVVNKLTVIASESYAGFVDSLQDEIKKALYERPEKVSIEYFFGRVVKVGDETYKIEGEQARQIVKYLDRHDYLDDDDRITEKYKHASCSRIEGSCHENLRFRKCPAKEMVHPPTKGSYRSRNYHCQHHTVCLRSSRDGTL